jgi:anti-anti-sigma regulatory factor
MQKSNSSRPGATEPDLAVTSTMADGANAVVEIRGAVRRSTAGVLAAYLSASSASTATSVVIDLSGTATPNHWLLSALAKTQAVLRARRASMRLVVGDDRMFELLHTSGIHRVAPIFLTRRFDDQVAARTGVHRGRAEDRQRVVDLAVAGQARGRVNVVLHRPRRFAASV